MNAKNAAAAAIHMNTNIFVPMLASMFKSATDVKACCIMTNRTVAMTLATTIHRALTKERRAMGKAAQREKTARGARKMRTKERQAPVRNRPNIQ